MQDLFNRRDLSCKYLFLITAVILFAGCGKSPPNQSISSISGEWLAIKRELIVPPPPPPTALEGQIDDFCLALNAFFLSPIGSLYQIHRPEGIEYLKTLNSAAERLKTAILNNDNTTLYLTVIEIDENLDSLQRIDKSLSNAGQRNSFFLFLFFSLLVITVILILALQYVRLDKAEKREQQSLAFSRETIIAQERERLRIARELHDTVLPLVQDAQVSALIRSICVELMPPDFARLSLNDSLAGLCVQFTKRTGIECACSIEDGITFAAYTPERQLHIYRMVQESFTNIEKHSKAGRAALVVRSLNENILICVSDDGEGLNGIPLSADGIPSGAGLGIKSMRQRADILGAKLDFISESGNGLMVRIELPLVTSGGVL